MVTAKQVFFGTPFFSMGRKNDDFFQIFFSKKQELLYKGTVGGPFVSMKP